MPEPETNPKDAPAAPAAEPPPEKGKRGPKRTPAQIKADLLYIEHAHIVDGKTVRTIAKELSAQRPYSISWSMIAKDMQRLAREWSKEAKLLVDTEKVKALKQLDVLWEEAMGAWHRSKRDQTRIGRSVARDGAAGKAESSAADQREVDSVSKTNRDGNIAYIHAMLAIQAERRAILGIDAAKKFEHSGPNGGAIPIVEAPLSAEEQDAALLRYFERQKWRNNGHSDAGPAETPASA